MKRDLLIGLLTALSVTSAHAIYQWDVPQPDLENVACWNVDNCEPTAASIHMYKLSDPSQTMTLDCDWFVGGFNPVSYSFNVDADDLINCGQMWIVDEMHATFEGPGFFYQLDIIPNPEEEEYAYQCLPVPPNSFPDRVPEGSDGCVAFDPGLVWDHEHFPDGQVALTEDFTVLNGETLYIEAGIEVYGLPGASLTVNGGLNAQGTIDSWISFTGDNWDGLTFGEGSQAQFHYTKVQHVNSPDNGGAVTVQNGGNARFFHSLISHNTTAGEGGAAYVEDGGIFTAYNSTISHNSGASFGGVYLAGGTALFESGMNLLTFNNPVNTDLKGSGAIPNVFFTNIYPQNSDFPEGTVLPVWYCDPGYVDAANGDFNVSYWSLTDPMTPNCIIDVSVNELENDPDGTPGDMGAFPFDQHAILHAAHIGAVNDRANDQGGYVLVEFHASSNDGNVINPVTMYSVWVQYPGMDEDEWVSAGTVAAIADPNMHYVVQVPTLNDQFGENENIHNFMIGTHSVFFPVPMPSATMSGFSLDNLAPAAVTGMDGEGWTYDTWPPTQDRLDISWNQNVTGDFDHFVVKASLTNDFATAPVLYQGVETSATFSSNYGVLQPNQPVYFWASAVDVHENASAPSAYSEIYVTVDEQLPTAFSLAQNHPNPFNPSTSIQFALPTAGQVNLSVYNMLGAKVATLVNGQQAAGRYEVKFDGSKLASGVYFYKLEAPGFSDLKKMTLVK